MLFFVYILASRHYGTLYVGSTSDLARRVWEHKIRAVPGFTAKYGVDRLVWFEAHETLEAALIRERQIKRWKRDWKINLIERDNPHWVDLYLTLSPQQPRLEEAAQWVPACAGTYFSRGNNPTAATGRRWVDGSIVSTG